MSDPTAVEMMPPNARLVVPSPEFADAYIAAQHQAEAVRQALGVALRRYLANATQEATYQQFWMVAGQAVIGHVSLRRDMAAAETTASGHIGYEIFPDFRGRGFGHRALALAVAEWRRQGFGDLLISCAADNVASIRIIEAGGGTLEPIAPNASPPAVRRYWIKEAQNLPKPD